VADLFDSLSDADDAGLFYVNDERPGLRRRKRGKGFSYVDPDGKPVPKKTKEWIESIAIPPAWTDVWICPLRDGHILATGRDARGRKQYRYHPKWREVRDSNKYFRLIEFADALPSVRAKLDEHLRLGGLPREKVLAAVVKLLDETLIRVGNDEYAVLNESYGLTTMQDEHAVIQGSVVRFEFTGKSGIEAEIDLKDRRLATIVKACQDLPGEELFQYLDDGGNQVDVTSSHVNEYLKEVAGATFTAKDFRTWGGTVVAAETLLELGPPESDKDAEKQVIEAVDAAAERLGNTRAVCRSCYVHPAIAEAHVDGSLHEAWKRTRATASCRRGERAVLKVLKDHAAAQRQGDQAA
jgi:DNA topoisomerase-1